MAHNIRKIQKTKHLNKSVIFWEFRAENPFSEVPQSSCIVWDTQGPFLRHVYFFNFRPAGQKPTKICRNGYLFPFPWWKQPRGPCPSQRAPDLKVHSQIESSVRPNGTPVMPLLHFGQVRRSSARCIIDCMVLFNAFWEYCWGHSGIYFWSFGIMFKLFWIIT